MRSATQHRPLPRLKLHAWVLIRRCAQTFGHPLGPVPRSPVFQLGAHTTAPSHALICSLALPPRCHLKGSSWVPRQGPVSLLVQPKPAESIHRCVRGWRRRRHTRENASSARVCCRAPGTRSHEVSAVGGGAMQLVRSAQPLHRRLLPPHIASCGWSQGVACSSAFGHWRSARRSGGSARRCRVQCHGQSTAAILGGSVLTYCEPRNVDPSATFRFTTIAAHRPFA